MILFADMASVVKLHIDEPGSEAAEAAVANATTEAVDRGRPCLKPGAAARNGSFVVSGQTGAFGYQEPFAKDLSCHFQLRWIATFRAQQFAGLGVGQHHFPARPAAIDSLILSSTSLIRNGLLMTAVPERSAGSTVLML